MIYYIKNKNVLKKIIKDNFLATINKIEEIINDSFNKFQVY